MALPAEHAPPTLRMTEEEFEAWCDEDVRAEFVDGEVLIMSPVVDYHYLISQFLIQLLGLYLLERPYGEMVGPEFQVRLRTGLRRVPDLAYLSKERAHLRMRSRVEGAPDAVWEIVSQDSIERDRRDKFLEYQLLGVREYWLIDPLAQAVEAYCLGADGAFERVGQEDGKLSSRVIPGFWLRPEWVLSIPLADVRVCLRELGVL
jgi:Uma2 family endonuclease